MSPAVTSDTASWSFPTSVKSCPTRSSTPWVTLCSEESGLTAPLKTRNIVMWPTNGSESVLNTKAATAADASVGRSDSRAIVADDNDGSAIER